MTSRDDTAYDRDQAGDYVVSPRCPTCGQDTPLLESPEYLLTHFTGQMATVLMVLISARRHHRAVSVADLAVHVYGDRIHDLKDPVEMMRQIVSRNKWKLMRLGWAIQGTTENKSGGFRLVTVEAIANNNPFARRVRNPFDPQNYRDDVEAKARGEEKKPHKFVSNSPGR